MRKNNKLERLYGSLKHGGALIALIRAGAVLALVILTLGPVVLVLIRAEGAGRIGEAEWQALRFTVMQAALSAGLSVTLAWPVARALARRRFYGRGALITLMGAPFILPVVVAVMGLLAIFGHNGLINMVLAGLGLPRIDIYGLHGVVLAHVFFNLPLAVRMLLLAMQAVPAERFRLAASLNLSPWGHFIAIEGAVLRRAVPGVFVAIFVICLTSFAVALMLGGGPRATTLELAIYQAMRFEFDLGRAGLLSVMQVCLALGCGLIAMRAVPVAGLGLGRGRDLPRWDGQGAWSRFGDGLALIFAGVFLLMPLVAVIWQGLPGLFLLGPQTWRAALHSLLLALGSTMLCLIWALPLATRRGELWALSAMALSPLVLGAGLFLMLRPFVNPLDWALPVTGLVNALMALPFVLRILRPEAEAISRDHARLRASLRLTPLAWLMVIKLPRLRRPMGFAAGLCAALAMGDLGVIALFASDHETLPLQVYRLMGAYRMEAAAGAALLLLMCSLGLFWLFDRGGRGNAQA